MSSAARDGELPFRDRVDAGRRLAARLAALAPERPLILALPRGGVVVGAEIARALRAPLDLLLVRKVGVPGQPELAAGALVDGDPPELVLNRAVIEALAIEPAALERERRHQAELLRQRRRLYGHAGPRHEPRGRTVVVVDDGLATGATARAALQAIRRRAPARLVLAVPVAPTDTLAALRPLVDELVCLHADPAFAAVGACYRDFDQVEDGEVIAIMQALAGRDPS